MTLGKLARDANQRQLERKAQTCVHFTGTVNDTCEMGINYREHADGNRPGMALRLPCFPSLRAADVVPCEFFEAYGMERAVADREALTVWSAKVQVARQRIVAIAAGTVGVSGVLECPCCAGELSYSIAASNGHIWGSCSTEECVRWME